MSEIRKERIRTILNDTLAVEVMSDDANIIHDLGADSLDVVEIMLLIEEEFDIDIPDEDWEDVLTVQQIIDYVEDSIAGR